MTKDDVVIFILPSVKEDEKSNFVLPVTEF